MKIALLGPIAWRTPPLHYGPWELITSLLAADVAAGRFSIVTFYERRVRRIFPALFVMLAVSAVMALWLLLPFELESFAASLRASALFVSNFYFMRETGYFVAAAITKPLLHTWSLAIEEQFYIFFPVYLYVMSRWATRCPVGPARSTSRQART